ncbi:MAG: DUF4105 domain-containing protein [Bacteroidales bacterium]|nr:DUF4105 domain-containing protein [Candidatus Physcousia equi]
MHIIIIFIVALVFKTAGLKAQEQVPQEGRLSASLLIAAPTDETPQRAFGHAFLRLRFESTDTLDYCFTQEVNAEQTAWDIMCGNYTTRMMAYETPAYLQQFAEQHRRVETLPLNLTPDEIRRLWQHLDNMIIATEATHSDFVKHSCSQELSNVLFSVVDGYVDLDNAALDGIGDNLFALQTA